MRDLENTKIDGMEKFSYRGITNPQHILSETIKAQEEERRDIANELHDNVAQLLTVCKLLLEGEVEKNYPAT